MFRSDVGSWLLRGWALILLAVGLVFAPAGTSAAAETNANKLVPVPAGVSAAALPGASVFGETPPNTPETVAFVLTEQNLAQLEARVTQGVQSYLSVGQFANSYGQTPANISQLQSYLGNFGISTQVDADNVDVIASGTAGEFDRALSVQQRQYYVPRQPGHDGMAPVPAQDVHGTSQPPFLPARIARYLTAILGLTNYAPYTSDTAHIDTALTRPQKASSNSCVELTGLAGACNLPDDFASNYGLEGLYRRGAPGAGETIGIVTLAALDPGAPEYFWRHVAHLAPSHRTVKVLNIDGGPGAPSDEKGTGETDLDVEQSGGVAPGANVIVYQAPNTYNGFADAFFAAASQDTASDVSASWGESETEAAGEINLGKKSEGDEAATNEALLELAAQGQSTFVSAGDEGAYDANHLGAKNLSVDEPGDSPYVTASGGTTLPWSGTVEGPAGSAPVSVAAQRAWGWDYLWQPVADVTGAPLEEVAEALVAGGGGGFSALESTPPYQQGVSGTSSFDAVEHFTPTALGPIDGLTLPTAWIFHPNPPVTHGTGSGRALPDVSADADPYSGYLLYSPSFEQAEDPALEGGWGGTSFVAPQMNGSTAVIDSYLGRRVGFWNPHIYGFATGPGSPFTPLQQAGTSNDNLYYTGQPGAVYNEATGLGYPNLTRLAADFAAGG